jgi:excisionase family DNA binding protein
METLLTKKQVAKLFGVTVKAIDKWMKEKRIPYYSLSRKCVRFRESELDEHLRQFKKTAIQGKPLQLPREYDRCK